MMRYGWSWVVFLAAGAASAADKSAVQTFLDKEVITPRTTMTEAQDYLDARVPRMPELTGLPEWEKYANRLRGDVLEKVVYRGEAANWRDAKLKVEWLDTVDGGPGYKIKKLRYEALPGLWIPALLYEPEKLSGKVPAVLNVNGHDGNGKAATYKQIRCINLAKRGVLALNVEWLGMGQLRTDGYAHTRMNQLDLCGTSGLAPFYLDMKRGLDVLLGLPNTDPDRVAVTGLSGGGWQTIFISSLDTRVKLTNPVAGYSGFRTRLQHFKDLGDSEQTPCDLATLADYDHLTAMMAPRPTLLTYNVKDDCCFESGYALPPLMDAASPVFKLYGREKNLRSHVNEVPGTHNYEKDNREAFYRMVGDFFFANDPSYSADEIDSAKEVKTKEELAVDLPAKNADFHTLAMDVAAKLPKTPEWPADRDAAKKWQDARRKELQDVVKAKRWEVKAEKAVSDEKDGVRATFWKLKVGDAWTVPAVEMVKGEAKGTTLLLADAGRKGVAAQAEKLLAEGRRVVAVDPFYFGECKVAEKDWLFALFVSAVGDRPLGLQASQVAAAARWAGGDGVKVMAVGPRSSLIALVAAGLEEKAIAGLELSGSFGSLKEVLEQNQPVNAMPEVFCFGLLESFDVRHLAALAAPRPVLFGSPSDRAKKELAGLKAWYATLGSDFTPLP